jgi:predicted DNA-binding transcriptional regulator AlpA
MPQVKLGTTSVWLGSEVEAWIQSNVDERDQLAA